MVAQGVDISWGVKEAESGGCGERSNQRGLVSLTRQHQDLELLVARALLAATWGGTHSDS